jgi:hypothetical protein
MAARSSKYACQYSADHRAGGCGDGSVMPVEPVMSAAVPTPPPLLGLAGGCLRTRSPAGAPRWPPCAGPGALAAMGRRGRTADAGCIHVQASTAQGGRRRTRLRCCVERSSKRERRTRPGPRQRAPRRGDHPEGAGWRSGGRHSLAISSVVLLGSTLSRAGTFAQTISQWDRASLT